MSAREGCAAALNAVCRRAAPRSQSEPVRHAFDPAHAAELTIQYEDAADTLGLGRINDKHPLAYAVAEGRVAAHPQALLFRRGDLVADPFAGHLALELGKGQQDIEGQPPHRARRVELLRHRDKRHTLSVKDLDEPGKIGERSGQPVDLVDDYDVDPAGPDIGEQALQRRSL